MSNCVQFSICSHRKVQWVKWVNRTWKLLSSRLKDPSGFDMKVKTERAAQSLVSAPLAAIHRIQRSKSTTTMVRSPCTFLVWQMIASQSVWFRQRLFIHFPFQHISNSCVDLFFRQHPHKLSSKINEINTSGVYIRHFDPCPPMIEFKDIGIVFVKKENIQKSLEYRRTKSFDPTGGMCIRFRLLVCFSLQSILIFCFFFFFIFVCWNPHSFYAGGFEHVAKPQLIDLHCLRLCFQVLRRKDGEDGYYPLGHAVSRKIMDKKSHGLLNIVELSSTMSQAQGGDKILLFCDRVKREDISIIFYEEEQAANDGVPKRIWERALNYKNCKSMVVHHQYAIKFNAPSYKDPYLAEARQTYIQLHRPSDDEFSTPLPFYFVPNDQTTKSTYSSKSLLFLSFFLLFCFFFFGIALWICRFIQMWFSWVYFFQAYTW